MMIYSMTATFGKLDNQTLQLRPGLNVIHAPNEWGKSTWCAFLLCMLYGVDSKAKTTKAQLADKERYAPWSGKPMSGRMELRWQGRDITIERWTKGRTRFGEFRAYETDTGLEVPELTASNCGEMLLGVERSVFLRSGFLRLSDLPVTEDESLRRRLNSLVTTGDERDTADVLAGRLKELKNKCRYNRSGWIPQAEAEKAELESKLLNLRQLRQQTQDLEAQRAEARQQIGLLENHKQTMDYEVQQTRLRHGRQAQQRLADARADVDAMAAQCAGLPDWETAQTRKQQLHQLHQQAVALDMEQQMLPAPPQNPFLDGAYRELTREQALEDVAWARQRQARREKRERFKKIGLLLLAGAVGCIAAGFLLSRWMLLPAVLLLIGGAVLLSGGKEKADDRMDTLIQKYATAETEDWISVAEVWQRYVADRARYEAVCDGFRQKRQVLAENIQTMTEGEGVQSCLQRWEQIAQKWQRHQEAVQAYQQAKSYAEAFTDDGEVRRKPEQPDSLTCSEEETQAQITQLQAKVHLLQQRLGQYQGMMEALGQEQTLQRQLEDVTCRLEKLYETYAALELAQETLAAARAELQRRFAPRIAQAAQNYFLQLTGGRYDRLTLSNDMSLSAGALEEDVLHPAQWRSEGTVDQMYLALRLAVAGELTPHIPLILDDALVRFDDVRHKAAMEILKSEGEKRQIILFTCQTRELSYE